MSLEPTLNILQDTRLQTMQTQKVLEKQTGRFSILKHMQKSIMTGMGLLKCVGSAVLALTMLYCIIVLSMIYHLLYSTGILNRMSGKDSR